MKTLITLIFVLVIGVTAQAQSSNLPVKVKTIATTIVVPATSPEIKGKKENSVSIIYIYKNAKVKKALFFITTNDNAKLA